MPREKSQRTALPVPANAKALIGLGAPVDYVVPTPGISISYGLSALAWSKRPNAARVLADFAMSPAGQAAWHGVGESASPLPGIPGSLDVSAISLWDPEAFPADVVNAYATRFNAIFKRTITALMAGPVQFVVMESN